MYKRTILSVICLILGLCCLLLTFNAPNGFTVGMYLVVGVCAIMLGILGLRLNRK
ncbi:hypothetical protein [Paenibacillus sp. GCM10023250]|uniref:hypothetical protein n=1 Tax=Paenibacillus sp. GCM10023250 TaxID=3252648 RepID=UPI0036215512